MLKLHFSLLDGVRRSRAAVPGLGVILALAATASPAPAQPLTTPLAGEPPTLGVHLPASSLVSAGDASLMEVNPGGLGLLPAWSLLYHHSEMNNSGRMGGTGDALLAATPLPLLRSVVLGTGLQWLRPPDAIGYEDYVKISFGLGWSFKRMVSVGLGAHLFISDKDPALDGLGTMDLGLAVRPFEWLGAGLVVRDLTTPLYDDLPLQRLYDMELVVRPLLTERLEVGLGARIGERRGEVDPRFRLEGEPLRGLRLFTQVDLMRRDFARSGDELTDVRISAGLEIRMERISFGLSAMLGRELPFGSGPLGSDEVRAPFQGLGATLRLSGERREPLFTTEKRLLVLELKDTFTEERMVKLVTLLEQIERRTDFAGVLFKIDSPELGWARVQELRGLIGRLRRAGKATYAFLQAASVRDYYLAAATDQILLDPAGRVDLKGLAMSTLFFRGLFDKVGASAQFVRIAEYKSAPEAYTRTTASTEVRRVRESLLEDLFGQLVRHLARDRKKDTKQIISLVDRGPFVPPAALKEGLVDRLVEQGDLEKTVKQESSARLVRPAEVRRSPGRWPSGPTVAVVLVEGDIVSGKSARIPLLDRRLAGDETVVEALRQARESPAVRAVVIRVNSPGGSALASHHIWQEAARIRKVKPLVVSMGDMAASGGYYVACAGKRIYGQPATITGSIGIFSGKFDLSGLMDKIGLSVDTHSRGRRALLDSFLQPYSEQERRLVLSQLMYYYRRFLGAVGQGRDMSQDQVHKVARGRVWTGRQAKTKKLLDAHGGLREAIEEAKRQVGLPAERPVRLLILPEPRQGLLAWVARLLDRSQGERGPAWLPAQVRRVIEGIPAVLLRSRSGEPLARVPFEIQF